jgi:protein disulfide-isomerase A1
LAPHFAEAATALKKEKITLAKVDCDVEKELCQEQGIRGFPTLKVFRNGNAKEFTAKKRDAATIISVMKK